MKVKEIMNRIFVIDSDIALKKAAKIMSKKGIGCLVVMKGKKVVGIITERDILKNISSLNKKISSVLSKNIISVAPETSLEEAAFLMKENKIRRLLVIDENKLSGIITATDLVANSDILNEDMFY